MILALILSVAAPALATPAPQTTPTGYGSYGSLPVIITVHTNAVCTTLRQTVLPIGYIAKTNDAAFADVKNRTLKVAMSQVSDDTDLEFLAHRDQTDVESVVSNNNLAAQIIAESSKKYPAQKNPEIEAMRQELARIIDLQRQYNSVIDAISGEYLDSDSNKQLYGGFYGQDSTNVQTRNQLAKQDFINANRILLGLQPFDRNPIVGSGMNGVQTEQVNNANPLTQPAPDASPGQQTGAPQIASQLEDAEGRLQVTAVAALQLCNSQTAKPSPTH